MFDLYCTKSIESFIHYIHIQCYTLYSYTMLYIKLVI
uniref:Uncharacterized protein n=1 Tax=Arundo donax TaxID=35708 RepID=A0A0A9BQ38_ARUDO